jgi:hypothetical protein
MRFLTTTMLAGAAFLSTASAQQFSGDEIVLRDFYGTVTLELSGRGEMNISGDTEGMSMDESQSSVVIDGGDEIDRRDFRREYKRKNRGNWQNRKPGEDRAFFEMLEDKPSITISAPEGTAVRIEKSAVRLTAEGDAGEVAIEDNVHLLVMMGDIEGGDVEIDGTGYVKVGEVAGPFAASVNGSGDIAYDSAGEAEFSIRGSGDIEGGDIRGPLEASIDGSGDIETGDVEGRAELSIHGSGDIDVGRARGGAEVSLNGSGDVEIADVRNSLMVGVYGSGDVEIEGGEVDRLEIKVNGSGDVEYGGSAQTARLVSEGSGGISVGPVAGNVEIRGKDIRIDGKRRGSRD